MRRSNVGVLAAAIALGGMSASVLGGPTINPLGIAPGSVSSRGLSINDAGQVAVDSLQLLGA